MTMSDIVSPIPKTTPDIERNSPDNPPRLHYYALMLVLKPLIADALRKGQKITSYLVLGKEYLGEYVPTAILRQSASPPPRLLSLVYKKIQINNHSALQRLHTTLLAKPRLADHIEEICIILFPTAKEPFPYLSYKLRHIPHQAAHLLSAAAPSVIAVVLLLPVHPQLHAAFRSNVYPRLQRVRTYHNYLFTPDSAIWFQTRLIEGYRRFKKTTVGAAELSIPPAPWPALKHVFMDFECNTPDFNGPTFDYSYLSKVTNVGYHLANHKSWEFNLHNFLSAVKPPKHASVIAIFWTPTAPASNNGFKYRFHQDVILPMENREQLHVFRDIPGFGIFAELAFADTRPPTDRRFWDSAKEYIRNRELNRNIFYHRQQQYLVTLYPA
ncbi:hypothetical protein VNI00_018075 [Paramarasmius palmivorus]|uniref:Uncharacterized protein n=1 Tax=Paramarasmius palmivorus TaxID=297713 RepID=A0AAW0B0D1_9AGAR